MFADSDAAISDVCVTLAVHAGIAAADVICCARLGEHAVGYNHHDAVELLGSADASLAGRLAALLRLKTAAAYHHEGISPQSLVQAERAMSALLTAAATV